MCYVHGSIDQAVHLCPMCRVFPHSRCPHQRDICRNRNIHPHIDVSYLKNAEVESFNGCGYCKWARTNPPPKQAGYSNPGWPGCCRPPAAHEYRLIQVADWRSVSIVHQIPMPPEIKAALDSLGKMTSPSASPGGGGRPNLALRSAATIPPIDRRSSGNSSPSRTNSTPGRSPSNASGKSRTSSPRQIYSFLNSNLSRSPSANAISSSVPTSSTMEQQRRQSLERRAEGVHSLHSSPKRKNIDLDSSVSLRRSSTSRGPSVTPSTTSVSVSKVVVDGRSQTNSSSVRRRSSVSTSNPTPTKSLPLPHSTERSDFVIPRSTKEGEMSSASSSSGSSDGLGSTTDSTVTSDGGFTDYLSDESEAELQRQAEARAALLAQNQAEELEFKAARQQLTHIDLRPPKSWNSTNIANNATPRLPSAPIPVAHTTQTRI